MPVSTAVRLVEVDAMAFSTTTNNRAFSMGSASYPVYVDGDAVAFIVESSGGPCVAVVRFDSATGALLEAEATEWLTYDQATESQFGFDRLINIDGTSTFYTIARRNKTSGAASGNSHLYIKSWTHSAGVVTGGTELHLEAEGTSARYGATVTPSGIVVAEVLNIDPDTGTAWADGENRIAIGDGNTFGTPVAASFFNAGLTTFGTPELYQGTTGAYMTVPIGGGVNEGLYGGSASNPPSLGPLASFGGNVVAAGDSHGDVLRTFVSATDNEVSEITPGGPSLVGSFELASNANQGELHSLWDNGFDWLGNEGLNRTLREVPYPSLVTGDGWRHPNVLFRATRTPLYWLGYRNTSSLQYVTLLTLRDNLPPGVDPSGRGPETNAGWRVGWT